MKLIQIILHTFLWSTVSVQSLSQENMKCGRKTSDLFPFPCLSVEIFLQKNKLNLKRLSINQILKTP